MSEPAGALPWQVEGLTRVASREDAMARGLAVLTCAQSRRLDMIMASEYGVAVPLLMEHASLAVARLALRMLGGLRGRVVAFVGPGNNGLDAACAVRHLLRWASCARDGALEAQLVITGAGTAPHAAEPLGAGLAAGATVRGIDQSLAHDHAAGPVLVLDGIVGSGVSRPLEGALAEGVRAMARLRSRGALVLSIDVPSGMDADTGTCIGGAGGEMVRADATITLGALKPGLLEAHARDAMGELWLGDIGAPRSAVTRAMAWRADEATRR